MGRILQRINWLFISGCAAAIETSACVWSFIALPMIPMIWPATLVIVQFTSSSFLQLVALPILGVSNRVQAEKLAKQMKEQHDAVMEMLDDVRDTMATATQTLGFVQTMTAEVHQMHAEMQQAK